MIRSRHWFVLEPMAPSPPFDGLFDRATAFEIAGNWYLAGETYSALRDGLDVSARPLQDPIMKARVLARAASCFELAHDSRASARFYDQAAREVASLNSNPQLAAELSNRAALQFRESSEYFSAGTAWVRAGEEFGKIQTNVIFTSENRAPLPISSLKSHLCGTCFEAGASAYEKALGNEMWSVMAYWRAGKAYAEGIPNIQAFDAYRRALNAHIKYYGTLEAEQLRLSLPLTDAERASKNDQIGIMEAALARCNNHHQQKPGDTPASRLQTNRQMAAAFHGFNLELQAVGNAKEAGKYRAEKNERQRRILASQRRYVGMILYTLWKIASDYGESLGRWALTCFLVILSFAAAYDGFAVVASNGDRSDSSLRPFDYFYFSVITFSTLGYGDLHPVGFVGKALTCLEVFAGLMMFGVLLSFVGNRFQRG
jgi:hypothetical protein